MFQKNDYVNYGTHGICKIEDIQFLKFAASPQGQNYYILRPVHQKSATVFVPAENENLTQRMRPVLSSEEIDAIILSIKDQDLLWIPDRKQRMEQFKNILLRRNEKELLLLISCLYRKSRQSAKGLSSSDAQILKKAEEIIDQEFSFALQISTRNIGRYIRKKLGIEERNT
ncbi:MAG: CarD family transcriptional regulator [Ruminococcus sp.]